MYQLNQFQLPDNFRGASAIKVQLWWIIQHFVFSNTPQFMYGFRRFLLRLFGAKIGKKVIIRPSVKVTYPWKLEIGDYSWVGDNVTLYTLGNITIGSNTIISQKCYLSTGSHDYTDSKFAIYSQPIIIKDSCWLATDVFVAPNVTIEAETIVGARSSVYKNITKKGLYIGNPCTFVKDFKIE